MKAVTIRVNDVEGVGGFVLPGDRVDVVLTRQIDKGSATTEVVLQNARVLAVDQIADERAAKATVAKSVTLEVSTVEAQKVWLASSVGNLSLLLRKAGETAETQHAQDHAQGFERQRTGQQRQGRDRDGGGHARGGETGIHRAGRRQSWGHDDDGSGIWAPGKCGRGVNQGWGVCRE